jgi:hypothetical protein
MIIFQQTMDAHSLNVVRDPNPDNPHDYSRIIAMVQWHPGRPPRVVPQGHSFTLPEMVEMTDKLREVSSGKTP